MKRQTALAISVAAVQVALAVNAVFGTSLIINRFHSVGLHPPIIAGILLAGALLLLVYRNPLMFIFASLPYVLYALTALRVTLDARGGAGTSIIYLFSILQMYLLYFYEDEGNG